MRALDCRVKSETVFSTQVQDGVETIPHRVALATYPLGPRAASCSGF
jgi:hypothetical protein